MRAGAVTQQLSSSSSSISRVYAVAAAAVAAVAPVLLLLRLLLPASAADAAALGRPIIACGSCVLCVPSCNSLQCWTQRSNRCSTNAHWLALRLLLAVLLKEQLFKTAVLWESPNSAATPCVRPRHHREQLGSCSCDLHCLRHGKQCRHSCCWKVHALQQAEQVPPGLLA